MSNHVTSLLRRKTLGVGLTGKAVVLLMGDLASDDGSGVWASKATMARELETTERTIQRTIEALSEAGFVTCVGQKKHRNGFTFEYQICVEAVESCPDSRPEPPTHRRPSPQDIDEGIQDLAPDTPSPVTHRHPTPDTPSPHGVTHRHPNQSKPSKEPTKKEGKPSSSPKRRSRIPEDALISEAQVRAAKKRGHSEQEAEAQFKKFKNDALAKGKLFLDWDRAFVNWLDSEYFRPIVDGVSYDNRVNRSQSAQRPENRTDPALEQIARLAGLSDA